VTDLTRPEITFFVIVVVAFALLITERLRIVVAAIFVLSAGMHRTGLSDLIGGLIGRWAGRGLTRALAVIMPSVAWCSPAA